MLTNCGHESTRGTTLLRGTSITGPWTEIGAIEAMPELSPSHATDDCTDQYGAGTAAWKKEYKTGEMDGGETSFTVNLISGDAMHDTLKADLTSTDETYLRIAHSDVNASTDDFPFLTKNISKPMPGGGGKRQLVISGKVNGEIVES